MSTTSQRLWEQSTSLSENLLAHSFVQALGRGTLPKPCYKAYIAQDTFILRAFAKAYSYTLAKCESIDLIAQFSNMIAGVVDELKVHRSFAAKMEIDLDSVRPNAAINAYTAFLLELAQNESNSVAVVLAAMVPSMRLYSWIGCQLSQRFPNSDHAYSSWIAEYSCQEFQAHAERIEQLLDSASSRDTVSFGRLAECYSQAIEHEHKVLDGLWSLNVSRDSTNSSGTSLVESQTAKKSESEAQKEKREQVGHEEPFVFRPIST